MQAKMPLLSTMQRPAKSAPERVLRQITCAGQAVAVSIKAGNFKLAYIAASLGKSEAYISRIRSGKRPVPEWFVEPFCRVTGSLLLREYIALQEAIRAAREPTERDTIALLARQMAA
jgi:hypothetical protein